MSAHITRSSQCRPCSIYEPSVGWSRAAWQPVPAILHYHSVTVLSGAHYLTCLSCNLLNDHAHHIFKLLSVWMCTHTPEAFERLCGAGLACLMRLGRRRARTHHPASLRKSWPAGRYVLHKHRREFRLGQAPVVHREFRSTCPQCRAEVPVARGAGLPARADRAPGAAAPGGVACQPGARAAA